ncbi:glycerophosphodiester phosphodiesterase [Paenibacillus glycanilyticus]|uniref:Glycerophosphoryl diester phosphodiesterase n=1 Tax=Paenibacillus glycanilyticus TaxID=126569 RepID=A0ABQ6GEI3_9BACL|nr:glycerophosphodiester phosphodiesterase family protein [Paenibacillus glycanilyticus]GLX69283.1 glycerophosphoryl diester phosphodiesterase [Paenibacillus glycanilyticus]
MRNECVAHRGWSGRAPENTLAAIQLAIDEPDVGWAEIDVQLSKDDVPVVIHDYKLRRTTNGRGEVRNYTAEELSALDAGSWFSPMYKGEGVPLLSQVLELARGRIKLNIELKTDGRYTKLEDCVVDMIKAYGMEDEVVITSFHAPTLHNAHKLTDGRIRTGLILDGWRNSLPKELEQLGAQFLSIEFGRLNAARVELLKQAGIQVMAWTPNDERSIRKLIMLDPDVMVCTNYPDRWRGAMVAVGAM